MLDTYAFFFFKQKTAYEMRISDWSSDVCSSDLTGGVDRILLDNFTPSALKEAVEHIRGRVVTEASGGIHAGNLREYAGTGVDFISMGALTHSVKSLDLDRKSTRLNSSH